MDVYLAAWTHNYLEAIKKPGRPGEGRSMSRREEDAYFERAEEAWSKLADIAARALPFSSLNPGKPTHEGNYAVHALPTAEAGQ